MSTIFDYTTEEYQDPSVRAHHAKVAARCQKSAAEKFEEAQIWLENAEVSMSAWDYDQFYKAQYAASRDYARARFHLSIALGNYDAEFVNEDPSHPL